MSNKADFRADLILLLTAAIWGLAFVFQSSGMDHIGPITFVFCRFVIAAVAIVPIWYLMEKPKQVLVVTGVDKKAMLLGVVMAAGMAAKLTANPLESVTTVTVQIVTLLTGDQEFDSPKTLAAFALGLMLFTVTLLLNIFALHIVKKYREQYD